MIFAAIAIAWLAYLVPHFVRRKDDDPVEEADPADRFSDSVRVVERGRAPLVDQDLSEIGDYEVSTPMTRRAAINDLRRLERLAALRRRRVLLGLLAVLSATIGVAAVGFVPWWAVAVPGGTVVLFAVTARISVIGLRRSLDRRYAEITEGSAEVTVLLKREIVADGGPRSRPKAMTATPAEHTGRLWDPVPITTATYVSKPLAPRTVRTIDLSGPAPILSAPVAPPVTADAPATPAAHGAASRGRGGDRRLEPRGHRLSGGRVSVRFRVSPAPEGLWRSW